MCVAVCSLALTCRERVAKPCTDRYTDLIPSQQAAPPAVGISDAAHPSNDPLYQAFSELSFFVSCRCISPAWLWWLQHAKVPAMPNLTQGCARQRTTRLRVDEVFCMHISLCFWAHGLESCTIAAMSHPAHAVVFNRSFCQDGC